MKIEFTGNKLSFAQKNIVKKAFKLTLKELEQIKELSICVNIVSPEEMQKINREQRNIDKVTDVLSFPSFVMAPYGKVEPSCGRHVFIGDMAICMEEVSRQAVEYNESKNRVLARLVIHSTLHMLGFDHIRDEDYEVMEPVQNTILNKVCKK